MAKIELPAPPPPRRDWALFFDIDGTLLDIANTPNEVIVPPALSADLQALQRQLGAVALVSGRPMADIDRLFGPLALAAAAQHGIERRLNGERFALPPHPAIREMAIPLQQFAAAYPGIVIEDKGSSLVIHYRLAPALAGQVKALADRLVAAHPGLEALPARMAADIKPKAVSKGDAIAWFLARPPFAGRIPVFLGDDVTDEAGFGVVNHRGGYSVVIGERPDTQARFSLKSPIAAREWLAGLARYYSQVEGP